MEGRGEQGRQLQINCAARRTGSRRGPRHAREQPRARDDARVGEGQSGLVQQSCASLCFRQRLPHALVRHEVQARPRGDAPAEFGAGALRQVGHSVARALLQLCEYLLAFGRRDALDVHVLLRAGRGRKGRAVAGAEAAAAERKARPEERRRSARTAAAEDMVTVCVRMRGHIYDRFTT